MEAAHFFATSVDGRKFFVNKKEDLYENLEYELDLFIQNRKQRYFCNEWQYGG
jgi:hypothetical protein